jgi:hypothetical protein
VPETLRTATVVFALPFPVPVPVPPAAGAEAGDEPLDELLHPASARAPIATAATQPRLIALAVEILMLYFLLY